MLFDFSSSALNTIQCHLLAQKILEMKIRVHTVLWIRDYLTNRPQLVRIGANVKSETKYRNTGAPQGTVLSLFIFCFLCILRTVEVNMKTRQS